jgi:hypothetical protein
MSSGCLRRVSTRPWGTHATSVPTFHWYSGGMGRLTRFSRIFADRCTLPLLRPLLPLLHPLAV